MFVNCDPSELANAARCFESCIPAGMQPAVQNYLLCRLAQLIESGEALGATFINYGSLWADEQSHSVPIAAINTYVQVLASLSAGLNDGFVFQNFSTLRCVVPGIYKVDWAMSINCATNNQDLSGCVTVNAVPQLNTTSHHFNGSGGSKNSTIGGTGILSLKANDLILLAVANHTATNAIIVEHANMSLCRVGITLEAGTGMADPIIFDNIDLTSNPPLPATAHGLSRLPRLLRLVVVMTAASAGYSIGDEVEIRAIVDSNDPQHRFTCGANATTVWVDVTEGLGAWPNCNIHNKTSGLTLFDGSTGHGKLYVWA